MKKILSYILYTLIAAASMLILLCCLFATLVGEGNQGLIDLIK